VRSNAKSITLTTGYPEVFDLKKEVFNENEEKSSGYIVCSVVSFAVMGFGSTFAAKPVSPQNQQVVVRFECDALASSIGPLDGSVGAPRCRPLHRVLRS